MPPSNDCAGLCAGLCPCSCCHDLDPHREVVLQLGGWAGASTDADYGDGLKHSTLYKEISKVRYEGLDLTALYVA